MTYLVRNTDEDGKIIKEQETGNAYTILTTSLSEFEINDFQINGIKVSIPNGGKWTLDSELSTVHASFSFKIPAGIRSYSLYLNDSARSVRNDRPPLLNWAVGTVPFRVGENTVSVRNAESVNSDGDPTPIWGNTKTDYRYGPKIELYRFTLTTP